MLHSKKTLVVIAVLVGLYTIGVNSETASESPAKIEKQVAKPKEFDKKLNKAACIDMFGIHVGYMTDQTKWWDKEYTIDQLANSVDNYIIGMKNLKTDSDLNPYFRDMIAQARLDQQFMRKYKTLDIEKWFERTNVEGESYNKAVKYCQRYVK